MISIFMYIYFPQRFADSERRNLRARTAIVNKMIAHNISPALFFNDNITMSEIILGSLKSPEIIYVMILDEDGNYVDGYNSEFAKFVNFKDTSNNLRNLESANLYKTCVPIFHNETILGNLYIGYSLDQINKEIIHTKLVILIICILIFMIGFIFAIGMSSLVLRPLKNIINTAKEISLGNLDSRAEKRYDEIGNVSNALNSMMDEIEQIHVKLKESNEKLESVVAERTEELRKEIEQHKRTAGDLIKAKEKAEGMNKLKNNFLANMSHELRTPLSGILGFSELINEYSSEEEIKDFSSKIYLSGKRLMNTLNSILDLSLIESNQIKVIPEILNINEELKNVVDIFAPQAAKKSIYLKFNALEKGLFCNTDKQIFFQIISNLVDNAIKFTQTGGVNIYSEKIQVGKINYIRVKVNDSGIGIPEKYLDQIFDEFRQVSEGISRDYEGNGLGLTIIKKYVQVLNGNISVSSKTGIGSTFAVELREYVKDDIKIN